MEEARLRGGLLNQEMQAQLQVQLATVEMRHVTRVPDCPKPSAVSTLLWLRTHTRLPATASLPA